MKRPTIKLDVVHTLETKELKMDWLEEEKVKFQFYISLLYLYLKCVNWRQNKYKSATDDWLIIDWLVLEIDFLLYFYFFPWLCILCIFVCISVFVFVLTSSFAPFGRSGCVTHAMMWCACAWWVWASAHHVVLLDGPNNQPTNERTNGQGVSRSRM